jgi:hypothetical protein
MTLPNIPVGYWFFEDCVGCERRFHVMERTYSGSTIVCSTPWHHEAAKEDMKLIAKLHNEHLESNKND